MKIFLLIFSFVLCSNISCSQDLPNESYFPEYKWLNKKLPLDTLISYQGDTIVLFNSEKHYVVSFWYTNCSPCIAEISWLNKLKLEFSSEKIEFIAISFDSKEEVDNLLVSHPFDFELYHLSQSIINRNMLALGYPTNLVVTNEGKVIFQKSGGSSSQEESKEIYYLLSEKLQALIN